MASLSRAWEKEGAGVSWAKLLQYKAWRRPDRSWCTSDQMWSSRKRWSTSVGSTKQETLNWSAEGWMARPGERKPMPTSPAPWSRVQGSLRVVRGQLCRSAGGAGLTNWRTLELGHSWSGMSAPDLLNSGSFTSQGPLCPGPLVLWGGTGRADIGSGAAGGQVLTPVHASAA